MVVSGKMQKVPKFVHEFEEVSSVENGGKVLFATDDFFAVAENLLKVEEPVWTNDYTEFGKWMDGWETQRKRIAGHDWTIIALSGPCALRGICVDTAFFTGNFAPRISIQAGNWQDTQELQNRENKMGTAANEEDINKVAALHSESWDTVIPMSSLQKGEADTRRHYFDLNTEDRAYTHLRVNIFPDGGIARLRVYGLRTAKQLRGKCVEYSNAHFGHPDALMNPTPSIGMFDGWETARKLNRPPQIELDVNGFSKQPDNNDWAILQLEKTVVINNIEVDTSHFKGNCPESIIIEGTYLHPEQDLKTATWSSILDKTKLLPNKNNGLSKPFSAISNAQVNHVKVIIAPDGGIARIRIYGVDV